jgi:hypothetical protein
MRGYKGMIAESVGAGKEIGASDSKIHLHVVCSRKNWQWHLNITSTEIISIARHCKFKNGKACVNDDAVFVRVVTNPMANLQRLTIVVSVWAGQLIPENAAPAHGTTTFDARFIQWRGELRTDKRGP